MDTSKDSVGSMRLRKPVFLVGLPGCGKTTFGRALARRLGVGFIDLDFYISQRFRASVSEIFAREGEAEFRRREAAMLREAGEMEDTVIACGGGTPCFAGNMDYMNSRGLTVLLTAAPDVLKRRIILGGDKRPLVKGKSESEIEDYIREVEAARAPFYSQAGIEMESSQLEDRRQISATVDRFIADHPEIFI